MKKASFFDSAVGNPAVKPKRKCALDALRKNSVKVESRRKVESNTMVRSPETSTTADDFVEIELPMVLKRTLNNLRV